MPVDLPEAKKFKKSIVKFYIIRTLCVWVMCCIAKHSYALVPQTFSEHFQVLPLLWNQSCSWIPKGFHIKAPGSDSHINFLIKLFAKVTQSAILGTILHQHAISFHLHHQLHLYIKWPDFMKGTTLLLYELLQLVLFYYIKSDTWHTDLVDRSIESL